MAIAYLRCSPSVDNVVLIKLIQDGYICVCTLVQ